MLKEIEKQDAKLAEKLGLEETKFTRLDRFAKKEDELKNEIEHAKDLLDEATTNLKEGKLKPTTRA